MSIAGGQRRRFAGGPARASPSRRRGPVRVGRRLRVPPSGEEGETGVDLDRIEISEEVGERGAGRCVLGNPEAGNIHVAPTVPGIAEGVGRDAEVGLGNGHELAVGPFDRL